MKRRDVLPRGALRTCFFSLYFFTGEIWAKLSTNLTSYLVKTAMKLPKKCSTCLGFSHTRSTISVKCSAPSSDIPSSACFPAFRLRRSPPANQINSADYQSARQNLLRQLVRRATPYLTPRDQCNIICTRRKQNGCGSVAADKDFEVWTEGTAARLQVGDIPVVFFFFFIIVTEKRSVSVSQIIADGSDLLSVMFHC